MTKPIAKFAAVFFLVFGFPNAALPQAASPDALAAAKEFVVAAKFADQLRTMTPLIMRQLKPLVAQGRPEVEKSLDSMMPLMMKTMEGLFASFVEAYALIYARHFTAEELKQMTAFYRTPAGQKLAEKQAVIAQEGMAVGQRFGQILGEDLQRGMIQELRKQGHDL